MKFCSLSSGSSGNCIYVESEKHKFLVDAGFSGKQIQNLLEQIGVRASDLDFILVTHEHIDHAQGVGVLSRRFDLPIFANAPTWQAMAGKIGQIKDKNIKVFKSNHDFEIGDLGIFPMKVYHDSQEAVGYVIESSKKKLTLMTDTGFVSEEMMHKISGSNLYYIEANHDPDMLVNGPYPEALKKRIASIGGHLSNITCANVLGEVLTGIQEQVFLGHLSQENNLPSLAEKTVSEELKSLGYDLEKDIRIRVAERHKPGDLVIL